MLWLLMALAFDTTLAFRVPVAPGESLQVVTAGAGESIVLIPGLIGSAYGYRHVVDLLVAEGYRAVVIEPLGLGGSSRPKDADYSLTAQADRIAATMDSLGVDSAVVVAHSIGGAMGFRLAYRHPRHVRALISLEGGPAEAATSSGFRRAMALTPLLKLLNGTKIVRGHARKELKAASVDSSWVTDTVIDGYTADAVAHYHETLDAFKGMAQSHEPEPLVDNLSAIQAPVLMLVGRQPHQSMPPAEQIALLVERVPAFAVDSLDGTGHFIQEERPDAVVAAVRRFAPPGRPCAGEDGNVASRPAGPACTSQHPLRARQREPRHR